MSNDFIDFINADTEENKAKYVELIRKGYTFKADYVTRGHADWTVYRNLITGKDKNGKEFYSPDFEDSKEYDSTAFSRLYKNIIQYEESVMEKEKVSHLLIELDDTVERTKIKLEKMMEIQRRLEWAKTKEKVIELVEEIHNLNLN